jgi:hypothetical protein
MHKQYVMHTDITGLTLWSHRATSVGQFRGWLRDKETIERASPITMFTVKSSTGLEKALIVNIPHRHFQEFFAIF